MLLAAYSPENDRKGVFIQIVDGAYLVFNAQVGRHTDNNGHRLVESVFPSGTLKQIASYTDLTEALRDFMCRVAPATPEPKEKAPRKMEEPKNVQAELDQALADAVYVGALYREAVASTRLDGETYSL